MRGPSALAMNRVELPGPRCLPGVSCHNAANSESHAADSVLRARTRVGHVGETIRGRGVAGRAGGDARRWLR